tara:strand:+ start:5714 stop:6016 length:303 start_codon:yes stop_codon:yes gene_type:complete
MIWILVSLLTISLLALLYFIYRAYTLAGVLADTEDYIKEIEDLSVYMFTRIEEAHQEMTRIDRIGAFEENDEAGTTFSLLKEVITNLHKDFHGTEEEKKQ